MRNLQLLQAVKPKTKITLTGRVTKIAGLVVEADGPLISIENCYGYRYIC